MKNLLTSCLLSLFCFPLFSQDSTFISFGIELGPKIVTNIFESDDLTEPSYPISWAISGNVYFNFNPKFQVKTGLGLHLMRIGQKDYSVLLGCDNDGNGGADQFNSWIQTNYSVFYFGIPTEVNYYLSSRKSRPYINFGGTLLINLKEDGSNEIHECGGGSIIEIQAPQFEIAEFLVLLKGGFGYQFELNQHLTFYLEPSVEYSLNPFLKTDLSLIVGDNELNKHMLNFALNTGLRF